jgi:transposase
MQCSTAAVQAAPGGICLPALAIFVPCTPATDVLLKDTPAQTILADKAYDAQARLIEPLLDKGKAVVIPSRAMNKQPREYDRHLCKARHLIENFFARLKQYRVIAARYDKTARNFLGAIHLAASMVWLA